MENEKKLQKDVAQEKEEVKEVKKTTKKQDNKIKNLTITELKKQNSALNAQTEHVVFVKVQKGIDEETGEVIYEEVPYKIKVDNVFRKTKQHQLLEDLIHFMNESGKRLELLDLSTPYITLLIIKHFTNLEIPDDIDKAIEVMHALIDLDIFAEIINLMPENELIKMYETLNAAVERMNMNIAEMINEAEEVAKKIENKEVKGLLENGEKNVE